MKEIFEAIALANGWVFKYARKDFMNLFSEIEQKDVIHFFVDPAKFKFNMDEYGNAQTKTYRGFFMMLYSSDFDEGSYEVRYDKYIKPLIDEACGSISASIACEYAGTIDDWGEGEEIINEFDYNLDGVILNYKITFNV